ncbi:acyltransferase family protein [Microbulbifer sp. ANSA003]|uniref:acyltransferase family protein n=1 Tax=Microbulbifer sp. ANSA003 TaxID=3243360 RepID=UPI00404348A8
MHEYRKEIDGLRFLAVAPVIIFHYHPATLPLGYLGVDLFFVISGYLITGLIMKDADKGSFNLAHFYIRRIRRILPAALVVFLFVLISGLIFFISSDLIRLSTSLLTSLFFVSNIYFWRSGGYFGASDELKPLLHSWSLSIEEQFYLVFPCTLLMLTKLSKNKKFYIILACLVILTSISLNIFILSIGGENPAFFLTPTRIWQLAIGVLVALLAYRNPQQNKNINILLSYLGFGMIIVAYSYPENSIIPAILITTGTGLMLYQPIGSQSLLYCILTLSAIRFIGLISYSMYLWHWPVISIIKYVYVDPPSNYVLILGFLFTCLASALTWKFIEIPFRNKYPDKLSILLIALLYILIVASTALIFSFNGFPKRHPPLANNFSESISSNFRCGVREYLPFGASRACLVAGDNKQPYSTVLLGNSHAQMYGPAFVNALNSIDEKGLIVPLNSCLPTLRVNLSQDCLRKAKKNYEAIVSNKEIQKVIIAQTWHSNRYISSEGGLVSRKAREALAEATISFVNRLEKAGKIVYVLGPIQIPGYNFPSTQSRKLAMGIYNPKHFFVGIEKFNEDYLDVVNYLHSRLGDQLMLPHQILCPENTCLFSNGEVSYFSDSHHLSPAGALLMTPLFDTIVKGT